MDDNKRYYRGVWIAQNSAVAMALDTKSRLGPDGNPLSKSALAAKNKVEADKHFDAAMAEYYKYFPAPGAQDGNDAAPESELPRV
jgi:hypothetical protein